MESSTIEILSMLGSWVSGIGTISAVIYAINVNKPRVSAIVSDIKFNDNGDFTIDVHNKSAISAHISHIRLVPAWSISHKAIDKNIFSENIILKGSDKRQYERLNIEVKPGMYQQFEFSAFTLLKAYCEFCQISKANKMMRMVRARIAIYLTTGAVCYVDLPKSQYQKIKNSMLIPVEERVGNLSIKNFPADYDEELRNKFITQDLDVYEYALRRHKYITLPLGISISS
jgi:hypothetical protein